MIIVVQTAKGEVTSVAFQVAYQRASLHVSEVSTELWQLADCCLIDDEKDKLDSQGQVNCLPGSQLVKNT